MPQRFFEEQLSRSYFRKITVGESEKEERAQRGAGKGEEMMRKKRSLFEGCSSCTDSMVLLIYMMRKGAGCAEHIFEINVRTKQHNRYPHECVGRDTGCVLESVGRKLCKKR